MKARTLLLPALLCNALLPSLAHAAPPDAKAPAAKPVAPPAPAAAPVPSQAALATSPGMPASVSAPPPTSPAAAAPPGAPAKPEAKLPAPKNPVDAALYGTVRLERAGRPIAIGTLLSGDGRILTALSPLTHGNQIDARYPEGQLVHVRVSHVDRGWDLALLTPEGDARHSGLAATHDPPPSAGSKLHAVGYVADKKLGTTDLTIKSKGSLRGGDSAELTDALELGFTPKPTDIGAPLINDKGEVVAIVARACSASDKIGCTLIPYAAPVSAIRGFLRGVPMRRGPWLGLEVVAFDAGVAHGVRIAALAPNGPASDAGLHAGPPGLADVVLAVDGVPVSTVEAFSEAVQGHTPGSPLRLMLLSEGRYREVRLIAREDDVGGSVREPAERVIQSNPARPWPHAPRPPSTPNPYR
ncbi:MAG: PDZ domain-containing protein [Polyangiaceae bacterium]